jgi:DNA modification methylase
MLNTQDLIRFGAADKEPNRVILADNLRILPRLADASVAMIYIDPPFATGTRRQSSSGKSYPDRETCPETFVAWLEPRLVHSQRVLEKTGSLFVHLDYRAVHYVKVALDRIFGHANFVNEIIWCYSVGGKSRRSFGKKHDTILWYANGRDYAFYADAIRIARKAGSHMRVRTEDGVAFQEKTDRKTGRVYRYPIDRGKVPEDWWTDIETLNHSDRERAGWPTQKPERLLERLLLATTRPGDCVADWFSGSGTTAVVAQTHDRRFVVIDTERDAIDCARERLRKRGEIQRANGALVPDVWFQCEGASSVDKPVRRMGKTADSV